MAVQNRLPYSPRGNAARFEKFPLGTRSADDRRVKQSSIRCSAKRLQRDKSRFDALENSHQNDSIIIATVSRLLPGFQCLIKNTNIFVTIKFSANWAAITGASTIRWRFYTRYSNRPDIVPSPDPISAV